MLELIDCFRTMMAIERATLPGELRLRYDALIRTYFFLESDCQQLVKDMGEFFDALNAVCDRKETEWVQDSIPECQV